METLNNLSPKERNKYLKKAPIVLVKFLSDLCYNVVLDNLNLPRDLLLSLKPYRKTIESLAKKKVSMKTRRQLIAKKGTYKNIFATLIDPLISLTTSNHDLGISKNASS